MLSRSFFSRLLFFFKVMGKISKDDRTLIKTLRQEKNWSSRRLLREFPTKRWSRTSMDRLLKKVDATGVTEREKDTEYRRR